VRSEPLHLIGNVNLDVVMGPLARWPRMGTEVFLDDNEVRAGGAAGNAALALRALGTPVRVHASLGRDPFGDLLARELGELATELERVPLDTAYSVGITHPNGERTFLTHLGHLEALDVAATRRRLIEAPPSRVLLCGYFLLAPLRTAATVDLLRAARARGHVTLLDTGWPSDGFGPTERRELAELTPWLDVVLPNEIEATAWTGHDDVDLAITAFAERGVQAVVKRGPDGASWWQDGRVRRLAAPRVDVADTIGAGDAFNAAFLAALQRGQHTGDAVAAAIDYASRVVATRPRRYPADLRTSGSRDALG
jgi:sugar/nucleoside kinase (ribokinase family)